MFGSLAARRYVALQAADFFEAAPSFPVQVLALSDGLKDEREPSAIYALLAQR